jgi:hypothetical protein
MQRPEKIYKENFDVSVYTPDKDLPSKFSFETNESFFILLALPTLVYRQFKMVSLSTIVQQMVVNLQLSE